MILLIFRYYPMVTGAKLDRSRPQPAHTGSSAFQSPARSAAPSARWSYGPGAKPRSAIIWTRSRELSLNVRYHRTHRTIISWSKCRPLKSSCTEAGSVIQAVTAGSRAFRFAPEPIDDDAAFATRDGLIVEVVKVEDPKEIARRTVEGSFSLIRFDIKMQPN